MSDEFKKEVIDLSWEHFQHQTFTKHCYECSKENNLLQSHKVVNTPSNYPEGINRFNPPWND